MSKIKLPERLYYPLPEAAEFLGCSIRDIYHYGAAGMIKIKVYIGEIEIDDVGFISLDLGRLHKGPNVDGTAIDIHTHLYSLFEVHYEDGKRHLLTADSISGFFSVSAASCFALEFSNDDFLNIYKIDEEEDELSIFFSGVTSVPRSCLCIFADDLKNIKQTTSMSIENTRGHTRTLNKQGEMIPSLLKMIPEFNGCDIENEPVNKIINILCATAASKGIELSIPDKNTMAKYLGRR